MIKKLFFLSTQFETANFLLKYIYQNYILYTFIFFFFLRRFFIHLRSPKKTDGRPKNFVEQIGLRTHIVLKIMKIYKFNQF